LPILQPMKVLVFLLFQFFQIHSILQPTLKGDLVRHVGICGTPSTGPNCATGWGPALRLDRPTFSP
jgi:hypothetical protein